MNNLAGKKILYVITKSNWGGAQAYVYALAEAMQAQGVLVTVAAGGTGLPGADMGLLKTRLDEIGIRVIPLGSMVRDLSIAREWRSFFELRRIMRSERPDIVHLNSSKAGLLGGIAARLSGVPRIVFTAHGWPHREPRPFFMRIAIRLASWLTILLSDEVIAVSNYDYEDTPVFASRKKISMIHNGIAPFELRSREDARTTLSEMSETPIPQDAYWFVMNAELHPNKGIDIAIRALAEIPEALLVIMGSGQEKETLEALRDSAGLHDRVSLLGFVADARSYLAAADCFLLPSRKEGMPFVLLEAGMASLPVIASVTGGIPEVIIPGKTGYAVTPLNQATLRDAMIEAKERPEESRLLGSALSALVRERFSETQMVEQTSALYSR